MNLLDHKLVILIKIMQRVSKFSHIFKGEILANKKVSKSFDVRRITGIDYHIYKQKVNLFIDYVELRTLDKMLKNPSSNMIINKYIIYYDDINNMYDDVETVKQKQKLIIE